MVSLDFVRTVILFGHFILFELSLPPPPISCLTCMVIVHVYSTCMCGGPLVTTTGVFQPATNADIAICTVVVVYIYTYIHIHKRRVTVHHEYLPRF